MNATTPPPPSSSPRNWHDRLPGWLKWQGSTRDTRCALLFILSIAGACLAWHLYGQDTDTAGHNSHFHLDEAAFLLGLVVLLTWLWFEVCVRKAREEQKQKPNETSKATPQGRLLNLWQRSSHSPWSAVVLSAIPAVLFVLAMRNAYNPAVFCMALVAILVAAEHYSGLMGAETKLNDAQSDLAKTQRYLAIAQRDLEEARGSIRRIENAESQGRWRTDLYGRYARASKSITAVLRVFDVDEHWWKLHPDQHIWENYRTLRQETLYNVLAPTSENNRTDSVCFVAELPWPDEYSTRCNRASKFDNLLGLTWRLVVLELVRQVRNGNQSGRDIQIRTARSAAWMHVVDDTVFQVIKGVNEHEPFVRVLTQDVGDPEGLAKWAREDILRVAERGSDAIDYVCAVLRWSAFVADIPFDMHLNPNDLDAMLQALGFEEWLSNHGPQHAAGDRAQAQRLCTMVFDTFLKQRSNAQPYTIHTLLAEVV